MKRLNVIFLAASTLVLTGCARPSVEEAQAVCPHGLGTVESGNTGGKVECIPPEAPLLPDAPEERDAVSLESLEGLSDEYAKLPVSNLGLDGSESPQDIADKLKVMLGAKEPVEGNYSEVSEVIEDGANVHVRFQVEGIPDDSVKATEHVVTIFLPAAVPAGVTGYGWRQKCWRAEDPDAWTSEPCP